MKFERITVDPSVMGGVPTLRGLRIPVATGVTMVADGLTVDKILVDVPDLEREDVAEALRFAAELTRERHVSLRTTCVPPYEAAARQQSVGQPCPALGRRWS